MSLEIIEKHMHGKISVLNKEFIYSTKKHRGAEFKLNLPINE